MDVPDDGPQWDDPLATWQEMVCFGAVVLFVASATFALCGYGYEELVVAMFGE